MVMSVVLFRLVLLAWELQQKQPWLSFVSVVPLDSLYTCSAINKCSRTLLYHSRTKHNLSLPFKNQSQPVSTIQELITTCLYHSRTNHNPSLNFKNQSQPVSIISRTNHNPSLQCESILTSCNFDLQIPSSCLAHPAWRSSQDYLFLVAVVTFLSAVISRWQ